VGTVRRGDHVTVLEGFADADRDGFLADRDMQEPGQLTCSKTLLDLLLEAADQEHLAEELPKPLRREGLPLLDRGQLVQHCWKGH